MSDANHHYYSERSCEESKRRRATHRSPLSIQRWLIATQSLPV